jgi:hypothetical protein
MKSTKTPILLKLDSMVGLLKKKKKKKKKKSIIKNNKFFLVFLMEICPVAVIHCIVIRVHGYLHIEQCASS